MKINKIIIVGGGSAGWMSAATLVRAFPKKEIIVIEPTDIPIIGVGESTLGSINNWVQFLDIDKHSFFPTTDASLKLSIKFTNFYKNDNSSFFYPFGSPVMHEGRNPFEDWHLKKYLYPDTTLNDFVESLFPAYQLFSNNKYSLNEDGNLDNFSPENDTAYHFDATKFGTWLKNNYCIPRGVHVISESVKHVSISKDGIKALILECGDTVEGDLYVDCTGFNSLLLGQSMQVPFKSYSDILPNDRAIATRIPYKNKEIEIEGYTNCTAINNGWCWNIPLWSRLGSGYVYSSQYVDDDTALEEFKQYLMSNSKTIPLNQNEVDDLSFKSIRMRVGIHEKTFVKNVVAIGLSAGFIEPLESNGLFSVHEFLFKLVDVLQRGEISQFDRNMYNVSVMDMFDNFAKFVALHYALSHRSDTKYWEEVRERSYEDSIGDPYFPYLGRSDAFYDLGNRYMDKWSYEVQRGGIPYIATGMGLITMNEARYSNLQRIYGSRVPNEIAQVVNDWNNRKRVWRRVADSSPSLAEYLKKTYYSS